MSKWKKLMIATGGATLVAVLGLGGIGVIEKISRKKDAAAIEMLAGVNDPQANEILTIIDRQDSRLKRLKILRSNIGNVLKNIKQIKKEDVEQIIGSLEKMSIESKKIVISAANTVGKTLDRNLGKTDETSIKEAKCATAVFEVALNEKREINNLVDLTQKALEEKMNETPQVIKEKEKISFLKRIGALGSRGFRGTKKITVKVSKKSVEVVGGGIRRIVLAPKQVYTWTMGKMHPKE